MERLSVRTNYFYLKKFTNVKFKIIGNCVKCFDGRIAFRSFYSTNLICGHINV